MTTIQMAIKSLAVSYHAYCVAIAADDSNGAIVWGELLLEDQETTGVEMMDPRSLRRSIKLHRELRDRAKIAA